MKSKTKQYMLLGLVVIIWGVIIVRFFDYTDREDTYIQPIRIKPEDTIKGSKPDQYQYRLNYADPFLKISVPERQARPEPEQPQQQQISYTMIPEVSFVGVVSSGSKNTGILKIEGRSMMVSEGDKIQDFSVDVITEQSLSIHYLPTDTVLVLKSEKN